MHSDSCRYGEESCGQNCTGDQWPWFLREMGKRGQEETGKRGMKVELFHYRKILNTGHWKNIMKQNARNLSNIVLSHHKTQSRSQRLWSLLSATVPWTSYNILSYSPVLLEIKNWYTIQPKQDAAICIHSKIILKIIETSHRRQEVQIDIAAISKNYS